jgi:hypothetical protein
MPTRSPLDGDVFADRQAVWRDRLAHPANRHTVVADQEGSVVAFAHLIFDDDQNWVRSSRTSTLLTM